MCILLRERSLYRKNVFYDNYHVVIKISYIFYF
jgi:hypothetical protein